MAGRPPSLAAGRAESWAKGFGVGLPKIAPASIMKAPFQLNCPYSPSDRGAGPALAGGKQITLNLSHPMYAACSARTES